jgi:hypothetical protein
MSEDLKDRLREIAASNINGWGYAVQAIDRIEAIELALTQSSAETAAAYERAAERFEKIRAPLTYGEISSMIRALATPDQSAALDAVRAEARAQGMREAAEIAGNSNYETWETAPDAILAAIKGAKA